MAIIQQWHVFIFILFLPGNKTKLLIRSKLFWHGSFAKAKFNILGYPHNWTYSKQWKSLQNFLKLFSWLSYWCPQTVKNSDLIYDFVQFECEDGWTPLSTIKFGWSANIKSMRDKDGCSRWAGCDISWWNPYIAVRDSSYVPSVVVLPLPEWRFIVQIS